jgi:ParB family transcriptional regulator, chromosome partitioning protein
MAGTAQVIYRKGKLYDLPIVDLHHDPAQPRKYFDEKALNELKLSIQKHGVLEPVLVRKGANGEGLLLISGERRFQASKLAGRQTVPAIFTDGDSMEISIVENLLRENLTAIEEAEAIQKLKTQHNYELSDLSAALGKSDSTLSEILLLNRLPDEVKNDCRNDPKAARGILVEIARKKTPATMTALYAKYKDKGLTRGEIRKRTRVTRPISAQVVLSYVCACSDKIDKLDLAILDQTQKAALSAGLTQLRTSAYKKLRILKV